MEQNSFEASDILSFDYTVDDELKDEEREVTHPSISNSTKPFHFQEETKETEQSGKWSLFPPITFDCFFPEFI